MSRKLLSGIDLNNQRGINAADPTGATDLATKQYVDNVAAGLNWKQNVRAASTANVTIASALINGSSMDGVSLVTGNRVLLKNQTAPAENGIYIVVASGAASRATDADTSAEVQNAIVRVAEGTVGADTIWQMVTDAITLNTTSLVWTQFTGGVTYTQGNGISISGGVITAVANAGGGLTVVAGGIQIDTSVVVRKFAADVGNGSLTTIPIAHGMGTADIIAQLRNKSTGEVVDTDLTVDTTNATFIFPTAPTSAQYRVVVHS